MSRHNEMPPVPPANHSDKGTGDHAGINKDTSKNHSDIQNSAEQGDTANIEQNTTNAGFYNERPNITAMRCLKRWRALRLVKPE